MSLSVSSSSTVIRSGIACCQTAMHELGAAASELLSAYSNAGSGFQDEKYQQLGRIVEECASAINKPVGDIEDCVNTLNQLLKAVETYEQINL